MKEIYKAPETEVIRFDFEDVLKSSKGPMEITDKDGVTWTHFY